jgi:hypothetical protein
MFHGGAHISLQPIPPPIPKHELFRRWLKSGMERSGCARILEELAREHDLDGLVDPDAVRKGERFVSDRLLFDLFAEPRDWQLFLGTHESPRLAVELDASAVESAAQLIRLAAAADGRDAFLERAAGLADADILESLAETIGDSPEHGTWPEPALPGIHRREHASLLLVSGSTRVLTDPQSLTASWTTNHAYPCDARPMRADAVAVTHQHNDHWHLPSILAAIAPDAPVVVPHVPRPNLLTSESMRRSLELAAQHVVDPAWSERVTIGALSLGVLPFFGEQPTVAQPGAPPGVRNYGNCYRVDCAEWSALVLADSGADPDGTMLEVVARSAAEEGPVDALLSCSMAFPEGLNDGLPEYLLTLPFERLEAIYAEAESGQARSMTSGPAGIAALCRAAGARYYLPYAHGFGGLFRDPGPDDAHCAAVAAELGRLSASTEVVRWRPGNVASFRDRALQIR